METSITLLLRNIQCFGTLRQHMESGKVQKKEKNVIEKEYFNVILYTTKENQEASISPCKKLERNRV